MIEKGDEMGRGVGGGAVKETERERESVLSFGIRIHEEKTTICFGSDLGKGRRLPIPGDEWEKRNTRRKNPLVGCSANPMILILMRASLSLKIRRTTTTTTNKKQRERERETHTYTFTQSYLRIYVLMLYYGQLH